MIRKDIKPEELLNQIIKDLNNKLEKSVTLSLWVKIKAKIINLIKNNKIVIFIYHAWLRKILSNS